jgi:hypothetical protein
MLPEKMKERLDPTNQKNEQTRNEKNKYQKNNKMTVNTS